jgi:hypothetical protein
MVIVLREAWSESFPCSSTDSAQVTFPTPWLRLPVATQSLGLPHDAGADFLLSVEAFDGVV